MTFIKGYKAFWCLLCAEHLSGDSCLHTSPGLGEIWSRRSSRRLGTSGLLRGARADSVVWLATAYRGISAQPSSQGAT